MIITNPEEHKLIPRAALIVYKDQYNEMYIESRKIENNKFLSGKPVSEEFVKDLVNFMSDHVNFNNLYGTIPNNLLYIENKNLIWFNKPEKRYMYYVDKLNIPDGEYCIPGIVFIAKNDSLMCYAYKGNLNNNSKLYHAPFFNVYESNICLGNYKLSDVKEMTFENVIKYYETIFYNTKFSHLGGSKNPTKDNLVLVTKNSKDKFDNDQLIYTGYRLKDLFK